MERQVAAYARADGVIVELHQAAAQESPRYGKFNGDNAIGSSAFIAPVIEFVSLVDTGRQVTGASSSRQERLSLPSSTRFRLR